jgi:hypothetical protein
MDRVDHLVALAAGAAALDLRAARLVAWFKRQDLLPLGYASYRAFAAAHVDWSDAWLRACVRLVESPLERVKAAACHGILPLRVAVLAPGRTDVANEESWLVAALTERPSRARRAPELDLSGDALHAIEAARELARIHLGYTADDAVADRYVLAQWRRRDAEATRREAAAPPAAPQALPPWCDADDPATALLGPWREPASLEDGLALLREVNALRRSRVLDLGVAYRDLVASRAWAEAYGSIGELARACDLDLRTLQRAKRLVESLEALPDTAAAVACGEITLDEAKRIASVATEDTEEEWLKTLPWYTAPDFARLVELAARGVPILPIASGVVDTLIDALALPDRVTFSGLERQMPAPRHATVHPDLPEAAAWFLSNCRPDAQRGIGRAKERHRYRCRNPEHRRPTLRVHTHHVRWRSRGGGDDDANLTTLCAACHLRGVHAGHIALVDHGAVIEWRYPGRRVLELTGSPGRT